MDPSAATQGDVEVLTNSLGYVFSQGSAFLLDADDTTSFDFPASHVVLIFDEPPTIEESAALFETAGQIDPELFSTSTSGYTQYGPAYLSLQSAVPDAQFIAGYVAAAAQVGVEYTPIVNGTPSLYEGGAAFPGNNWRTNPQGQAYLGRIPATSHDELAEIRGGHLRLIDHAQQVIPRRGRPPWLASRPAQVDQPPALPPLSVDTARSIGRAHAGGYCRRAVEEVGMSIRSSRTVMTLLGVASLAGVAASCGGDDDNVGATPTTSGELGEATTAIEVTVPALPRYVRVPPTAMSISNTTSSSRTCCSHPSASCRSLSRTVTRSLPVSRPMRWRR